MLISSDYSTEVPSDSVATKDGLGRGSQMLPVAGIQSFCESALCSGSVAVDGNAWTTESTS